MKFGVVQFPGSNCDFDTFHVLRDVMKRPTVMLWHKDHDLQGVDCVVLPGGFSYGDYLRSGAIARFSPLMQEVKAFARRGGRVLGICNGFQILLELGLLPGAMLRNKNLKFLCQHVHVRIENDRTDFTRAGRKGQVLRIPIAHFDGNYYAPPRVLKEIERRGQVVFRYCDAGGRADRGGQRQRLAALDRRHPQQAGQRPRPDAPPGAGLGADPRQRGRPDGLRIAHPQPRARPTGAPRRREQEGPP